MTSTQKISDIIVIQALQDYLTIYSKKPFAPFSFTTLESCNIGNLEFIRDNLLPLYNETVKIQDIKSSRRI